MNGSPLQPGDKIHYIINITNDGNMNQGNNNGHEFIDYIPSYTSYADNLTASSGSVYYNSIFDRIEWDGIIAVGSVITIQFDVVTSFPLDNGTIISNDAIAIWDSDGDGINDATSHAYANLSIVSSPHLTITKTDSNDPVNPGDVFNYTITITNDGNANATNVIVKETYDDNVTFVSSSPSGYGNDEWHIPLLQPGDSYTINITVRVRSPLDNTWLYNYVNVTCDEGCYNETDETTQVISAPVLHIAKSAVPAFLENGSIIKYTIDVWNDGTMAAHNVTVTDLYDSRVAYISSSPSPLHGNNVWMFDELNVGDTIEITIFAKVISNVSDGDEIWNYANVTCDENSSDEVNISIPVKNFPPHTYKKFIGEVINVTMYNGYLLHYIVNSTIIELVSNDNGSGVNVTYYRIFKFEDGRWIKLFDWHEYGWRGYPYRPINLSALGILYNLSACGKYQIEFYSIDNAGNVEEFEWNDVFVDCYAPVSTVEQITGNCSSSFVIKASASDDGVGVRDVKLYYRYSPDNETWSNWTLYGIDSDYPYMWDFTALNGTGYYEFYTIATDYFDHVENKSVYDAICHITNPWDVNGDGHVDVADIIDIASHFGEHGSPHFIPEDVNGDGSVDILDIIELLNHWSL